MPIVVLDAPSHLGLRPGPGGRVPGVDAAPAALRAHGLLTRLGALPAGAVDAGAIPAPPYDSHGWPARNRAALAAYTSTLADGVASALDRAGPRGLVVLLGGDCAILVGALTAVARQGRTALAFIDAHGDFRHEGNSPVVDAAAGEELALVTGRGSLTRGAPPRALVADDDVLVLGLHDPAEDALPELRAAFPVVATVAELRAAPEPHGPWLGRLPHDARLWVHVDADVLDPAFLPAVDSPEPGGLTPDELVDLLVPLLADPRAVGVDLSIYDPGLDPLVDEPSGGAALLVEVLVTALGRASLQRSGRAAR